MTAYKLHFLDMWGWRPSSVDDMTRDDFRLCKALVDHRLAQRRNGG